VCCVGVCGCVGVWVCGSLGVGVCVCVCVLGCVQFTVFAAGLLLLEDMLQRLVLWHQACCWLFQRPPHVAHAREQHEQRRPCGGAHVFLMSVTCVGVLRYCSTHTSATTFDPNMYLDAC
jgi:hypothetical protein